MENQHFNTEITFNATPQQVFQAVNQVRRWWSENITGDTDRLHGEFTYRYQDVHHCRIRITEWVPNEKVVWHVVDNYFNFTGDPREWTGTNIIFELSEKDGKTHLRFTHQGLVPSYECFQVCHDAWTHYIQGSLAALIRTGQGSPTPKAAEATLSEALSANPAPAEHATTSIWHRLLIETPVETIYNALTTQEGLAGWWTPTTHAEPVVGSTSTFTFTDYVKEMKVEELIPYSRVKWRCITGFADWIGTTITFTLEPRSNGSLLFLRHEGWEAYTPDFASCTYDWGMFLRSLKFLCETGKGLPYPHQYE
ncbi:SRPBCC domain-containing protein [Parapedobacter lycopersici]|uniref:SRPBCC family protein n=1 Tax=Parapedobacter lycopersici TaxID=1864939 RepID=UPI00333EFAE1